MKTPHIAVSVAAATLLAAGAATAQVEVGDVPEYSFETMSGDVVSNESNQGSLVVFDFWATWCGPCIASMPHMEDLYDEFSEQGVKFYGISLDEDMDALDEFMDENDVPWDIYAVGGWKGIAEEFGVRGIPDIYVMGSDGTVVWSGHPMGLTEDVMADLVEEHGDPDAQPAERANYAMEPVMDAEGALEDGDTVSYDGKVVDEHSLDLEEGDRVVISVESNDFDTMVFVHGPDGSIEMNDDSDGTNSQLTIRSAEAGTYTVYVTSFGSGSGGDYDLSVEKRVEVDAE